MFIDKIKKFGACILLVFIVIVVIRDSSFHFSKERINEKRQHNSAQRHWSLHYSPRFVYLSSPIRYLEDLKRINNLIEPGFLLIADKPTSYYAAAMLPVYIRNIHRHHASKYDLQLLRKLQQGNLCYMHDDYHRHEALSYLQAEKKFAQGNRLPPPRYFILNKDKFNNQLRWDCLAVKSRELEKNLLSVAHLLYSGKNLNLYQLDIYRSTPDTLFKLPLEYLLQQGEKPHKTE